MSWHYINENFSEKISYISRKECFFDFMITAFLAYLQHQKRYSLNTIMSYEIDLQQFVKWLGSEEDLLQVEHSDVRSWLLELLKTQKHSTVHRKMSSLQSFYKYLLQQEQILITLPKQEKRLPTFLKERETEALFSQIEYPDTFDGLRDELILQLFYGTGMRVSELVGLQTASVDFHRKVLKVLGKRNKERFVPLLPFLLTSLQNYIQYRDAEIGYNDFLFVNEKNTPLNRGQVYYIVRKYLSQISSAMKRSPHVLRHTFATQLLNAGVEMNALKELLGHSNLAATQVYTHSTREQLKKDYKQAHPRA